MIWAFIPKISRAFIVHQVAGIMVSLAMKLPGLRKMEVEADTVGLHLAAKACYDVREVSKFLETLAKLKRGEERVPNFVRTHPSIKTREKLLNRQMEEIIDFRERLCQCPPLWNRSDLRQTPIAMEREIEENTNRGRDEQEKMKETKK